MQNFKTILVKEPQYFINYQKWRQLIYKTNLVCMLAVLTTEIAMYFIFLEEQLFLQPIPVYLFRFLILPTMINGSMLLIDVFARRIYKSNENVLNMLPVLQLTLMCFMVSCVHHVFAVTFCTFSFPIFLSSIFNSKRLTRSITLLGMVLLTIAQLIGPGFNDVYSDYLLPEYFVAVIALLASFLVCTILVRFQDEKNKVIEQVYQSQMDAIAQLNLDQKTGLYGVTAFHNYLDQLLQDSCPDRSLGIAMLDIDDFKKVNDTFGHAKGDDVIQALANLMKELCGDRFFPVRFGGEEFIILFYDGDWQEYRDITKRLLIEFSLMDYDFTDSPITISAGIAKWEPGCTSEEFFMRADKALYASKASGKNRITTYDKVVDQQSYLKNATCN